MFSKLSQKAILMHLFFFSLFLVIPTLAFVRPPHEPFFPMSRVFLQDTVANCMLLCFFYLNYYILIPKVFFHRKYVLYLLWVVLFLTIALTVPHVVGKLVPEHHHGGPRHEQEGGPTLAPSTHTHEIIYFVIMEFRRHLSLFFSALFFSFLLRTREHLAQLNQEKLEAELTSLKSQINPHFLFNTLNSIYALSVKKDDRASEAIINLSGLMRYVIKDANRYRIALQKEIDYIANYIQLQKARLGNTADVRFECSGDPFNMEITPLILITFIENSFKYGVNPDVKDCVVEITLQVTETGLRLYTFNKKVHAIVHANSTGIGINNTTERLKHLYPEKHHLQVTENAASYSVTLLLELI